MDQQAVGKRDQCIPCLVYLHKTSCFCAIIFVCLKERKTVILSEKGRDGNGLHKPRIFPDLNGHGPDRVRADLRFRNILVDEFIIQLRGRKKRLVEKVCDRPELIVGVRAEHGKQRNNKNSRKNHKPAPPLPGEIFFHLKTS